ncbi:MAG TPA: glycosyltransferase family A protein [Flavipsychrobacter sp.]|nr:glycosyltransferase family A protein [Flavipsychrobacter sp.]
MTEPLVSIIIPCYNAGAYITDALKSIVHQTYTNIEVIVIDDGSTDDSIEKIQEVGDKRIHVVHQENKGQGAASNVGFQLSKGEYIKFFDADDIMCQEHIELQVKKINGQKNVIASSEWYRFFNNDMATAVYATETVWNDLRPLDWLKKSLSQQYDMMAAWLWLIPRELLIKAGGWDERLSLNNDFEFSVRLLLQADKVVFTRGAKVYYRSGRHSALSRSSSKQAYEAAILSTELACNYLLSAENSPIMKAICADRYQEWCFRIYPHFPEIVQLLEQKVQLYGGSSRQMEGGKLFQKMSDLVGWKMAKRIKFFFYKIGYVRLFESFIKIFKRSKNYHQELATNNI